MFWWVQSHHDRCKSSKPSESILSLCSWFCFFLLLVSRGQSSSVSSGRHQRGVDTGRFCSDLVLSSKKKPRLIYPEPDRVPSALQIPFLRSGLLGRCWRNRGGTLVFFIRAQVRSSSRRSWEFVNSSLFTGSSATVHTEQNEAVVTQMISFSGVEWRTVWGNMICLNAVCDINCWGFITQDS